MPFLVTEPVKITGTSLGYAIYPYEFSFLDREKLGNHNVIKLCIFQMKDSNFIEIDKVLYQKEMALTMQNAHVVDEQLKKFIMQNEKCVKDYRKLEAFFDSSKEKVLKE